jgi:hypothetical protein
MFSRDEDLWDAFRRSPNFNLWLIAIWSPLITPSHAILFN